MLTSFGLRAGLLAEADSPFVPAPVPVTRAAGRIAVAAAWV